MESKPSTTKTFESRVLEAQLKLLSFEEFIERDKKFELIPSYNNFWCFFYPDRFPEKQESPYYKKFLSEHTEKAESLLRKMKSISGVVGGEALRKLEQSDPFEKDFYDAYKIMRSYGATNSDLGVVPYNV